MKKVSNSIKPRTILVLLCLVSACHFFVSNVSAQGIVFPAGFDTALASSETTSLYYYSEPGDFIGQGQEAFFTPANGTIFINSNFDNGVSIFTPGFTTSLGLDFAAPLNAQLTTGLFENATRFPFQAASVPGLNVSGDGRGSNMLTGQFEILEIDFDAAGSPIVFDAIFEQHSEGADPALFGRIRVNASAVPEPSGIAVSMLCLILPCVRRRRN